MVAEGLRRTGYDEVALTSLSTADFCGIEDVVRDTVERPELRRPGRRCRSRRCGSTPSPSASPPRSRRPAAPASPSPPRRARGGCARSSTSSSARRTSTPRSSSAYSQGWRRMKLYFLTGLPTETDEDTLGIAALARNVVAIGRRVPQEPVGHRLGRRVRAQAVHPVPVVRPEHPRRAAAQGQPAARRPAPRAGASSSSGTTRRPRGRGPRQPRRPPPRPRHRGRLAPRRHVPGVVRALRPRPLARRDGAPRPDDRLVRVPPPHRGRGPARGTTSRPASTRTSSGRTGATRSTRSASRTAAGRRATTAAPAPATASSTSSPRPCRRPAAARAPARTSPAAARCPVTLAARPGATAGSGRVRVRLRFAKLGKVRFTSHRDVARIWERALRRAAAAGRLHRGVLAPPQAALRAGPVDRPRVAGRVPRHRPRRGHRRRPSTSPGCPRCSTPALPAGVDVTAAVVDPTGHAVAAAGGHAAAAGGSRSRDVDPPTLAAGVERAARRRRAGRSPGSARARTSPTTSAPTCSISPSPVRPMTAPRWSPSSPPNPGACAAELLAVLGDGLVEGRCLPDPPMDADRRRPARADPGSRWPRRRRRTPRGVRHEKGTSR